MRSRRGRYAIFMPLAIAGLSAPIAGGAFAIEETVDSFDTTHSLVGSYLAGRFARTQQDASAAAEFYRNALIHDPRNELLLEQAFQIEASQANWPRALKLAEDLTVLQPKHRMAQTALALSDFKSGDWKDAIEHFRAAGSGPIGELTSALALAWVKAANKDYNGALALLEMPKQAEWAQFFLRYHRALIADIAGRKQDAKAAFEKAFGQDTRTLRTALAYARHAAHAGDRKLANTILKEHLDKAQGEGHPLIRGLLQEIRSGNPVSLIVQTPSQGMAEVFYGLGEALIAEGAAGIGVLYMQMALHVEPDQQFALAALANAYEANKQYAEAIATYDKIPEDSPLESAVEIRKAFNLNSLERVDEAKLALVKLLDKAKAAAAETKVETKPAEAVTAPDANATSAADAEPADTFLLKLGSRGGDVVKLQEALMALGYDVKEADGKYGETTLKSVAKFQSDKGMKSDGLAGPETFAAVMTAHGGPGAVPPTVTAVKPEQTSTPAGKLELTVNDQLEILDALGNITRSRKMYAEAVGYYDQALALITKPEKRHWAYFYARGTSYERLKNWPAAELDLEKAMQLFPDQPLILNYLGYSWIDQGRNMKEGMTLIEKAVALKPDDGYIVDSLGWAHFKMGNFQEAVRYLERAVELKPDDPVLNDHLGDALWKVGREREAKFQWDQALSLKPEPEDVEKIKIKLEQGMAAEPDTGLVTNKQASQTKP